MNKKNTFKAIQKVAGIAVMTAAIGFLGVSCGGGDDGGSPGPSAQHAVFGGYLDTTAIGGTGVAFLSIDVTLKGKDAAQGDSFVLAYKYLDGTVADSDIDGIKGTLASGTTTSKLILDTPIAEFDVNLVGAGSKVIYTVPGYFFDSANNNDPLEFMANTYTATSTLGSDGKTETVTLNFGYNTIGLTANTLASAVTLNPTGIAKVGAWTQDTQDKSIWTAGISDVTDNGTLKIAIDYAGISATERTATISNGGGTGPGTPEYTVTGSGNQGDKTVTIKFNGDVSISESDITVAYVSTGDPDVTDGDVNMGSLADNGSNTWTLTLVVDYDTDANDSSIELPTKATVSVDGYNLETGSNEVTFMP